MAIHPTAIISPKADLDSSVEVGPYAIIEDHVRLGPGTRVGPHAYLTGHTEMQRDNDIHFGAVIGHVPQDLKFDRSCRSWLRVGCSNVFREYVTIHRGTEPESETRIGHHGFFMANAHVGHNCVVGNNVIVCNAALLAGHVHVGDRVFISGGAAVHQFIHIGWLAMISGNARITMDVPPFLTVAERNEVHGINLIGLKRAGISSQAQANIKALFKLVYRSGLATSAALARADTDQLVNTPEGTDFIKFIRSSTNGICRAARPGRSPAG